jgi:hypothetical protein
VKNSIAAKTMRSELASLVYKLPDSDRRDVRKSIFHQAVAAQFGDR